MARWKRFRSGPGDALTVSLAEEELGLLRSLPEQLRVVLESEGDDLAQERLFPRAYRDPTAESEEAERRRVHPERCASVSTLSSSPHVGRASAG